MIAIVKGLVLVSLLLQETCGNLQLDNRAKIYHSFPTHPRVDKPINNGFAAGECCMLFDHFDIPIGSSATFNSPNFPKSYPSDMTCGWNFTTDAAYTFDMHCHFSHLKRNDFISMLDRHYSLYSYIENVREKEVFFYFRSNSVQVGFHSDDVMSAKGFECTIWPVQSQCNLSTVVVPEPTSTMEPESTTTMEPETTTIKSPPCASDQFMCDNGYCVDSDYICDNDNDCGDLSDEKICGSGVCSSNFFSCNNGACIYDFQVCDGTNNCVDFADERNCSTAPCKPDEFRCDNGFCIPSSNKCDESDESEEFDHDCSDSSDETNCGECDSTQFKCPSGKCILGSKRCNQWNDCGDLSDEMDCGTFKCIGDDSFKCDNGICLSSASKECDGFKDCIDGSDERNCTIE